MKLEAILAPLEGKYYGTKIVVRTPDNEEWIMIWCNIGNCDPSERELEAYKRDQMLSQEEMEEYPYEVCDNHYESVAAYEMSKVIVKALDGLDIGEPHK